MIKVMQKAATAAAGVLVCFGVCAGPIKTNKPVTVQFHGNYISLSTKASVRGAVLKVSGPDGFLIQKFEKDGMPSAYINDGKNMTGGQLVDGLYHYEISGHVGAVKMVKDTMNNGRGENNFTYAGTPLNQSGSFRVVNGQIKTYIKRPEPKVRVR